MAADPRPLALLNDASRTWPGAWKTASMLRKDRGREGLPDWPAWCYLPISGWLSIALHCMGKDRPGLMDVYPAQLLAALGPWRYTQGIYRYNADLYDALRDTVPQGDMPVEVLYRLPEWSLYLETPGLDWAGQEMAGFFAHLEYDTEAARDELRFFVVPADAAAPFCTAVSLHMGDWTITEALDRSFRVVARRGGLEGNRDLEAYTEGAAKSAYPLVSLLLYLCSDEPDVADRDAPGERPARPRPTKVKGGWELFPARKPRIWRVGEEVGAALHAARAKSAADPSGRKGPAAHVRRAHWHGYWSGARSEEAQMERPRRYRYRWLPPIIVGVDNE